MCFGHGNSVWELTLFQSIAHWVKVLKQALQVTDCSIFQFLIDVYWQTTGWTKLVNFSVRAEKRTEAVIIRASSSLPDCLTLSSPASNLNENLDTNEDQESPRLYQSCPPVPCLSPRSDCSSQCAVQSETGSVTAPVIVNLSEMLEPEEVRSPAVSEAEEVSSSSGSYSVTSVTTDISKREFFFTSLSPNQVPTWFLKSPPNIRVKHIT